MMKSHRGRFIRVVLGTSRRKQKLAENLFIQLRGITCIVTTAILKQLVRNVRLIFSVGMEDSMQKSQMHELTLATLASMDGGRIGEAFQLALKRALTDCDDRPGVSNRE